MRGLFVGAGQFARIQLEGWKPLSINWVGICNRTPEKAAPLARDFGIPEAGSDLATMIEALRPDFVDICTSVGTHLDMAKIAAQSNVPILCQKPIAPTLEESKRLVAICNAHETRLMINDNWRWQAWYREIRKVIAQGLLGNIFNVYMKMRTGDGFGPDAYAQQPYFKKMEKFLIFETGIHYIDTIRFLFGEPESVSCSIRRRNPEIQGEDSCLLRLNYNNDLAVTWDADRYAYSEWLKPPANGFLTIEGSMGNLHLDPFGKIMLELRGSVLQEHKYVIPTGYRGGSVIGAQRHFLECLKSGQPFETEGDEYLKTVEIVFAAYKAAKSQEPLSLKLPIEQS